MGFEYSEWIYESQTFSGLEVKYLWFGKNCSFTDNIDKLDAGVRTVGETQGLTNFK